MSASVAVAVVTSVVFSGTEKVVVVLLNTGATLVAVVALPASDQELVPSSFVARTCT